MIFHNTTLMYIQPFTTVDWPEIWCLMEVSTIFFIYRYCVFNCYGRNWREVYATFRKPILCPECHRKIYNWNAGLKVKLKTGPLLRMLFIILNQAESTLFQHHWAYRIVYVCYHEITTRWESSAIINTTLAEGGVNNVLSSSCDGFLSWLCFSSHLSYPK